jgi:hypothetical protein
MILVRLEAMIYVMPISGAGYDPDHKFDDGDGRHLWVLNNPF